MKRRRLILLPLGCVAAIILAILVWPREPEYKGVSLSTWLERGRGAYNFEFEKAIQHIGTNALPFLVRAVDCRMPRWSGWFFVTVAPKMPKSIADSRFIHWLTGELAMRRALGAINAFGILGRRAAPALIELRRIANRQMTSPAGQAILRIIADIPADFDVPPANSNPQARAAAFPYRRPYAEICRLTLIA